MEFIPQHETFAVIPGPGPVIVAVHLYREGGPAGRTDIGGKLDADLPVFPVHIRPAAAQMAIAAQADQRRNTVLILPGPAYRNFSLQLTADVDARTGQLGADAGCLGAVYLGLESLANSQRPLSPAHSQA